MEKNNTTFSIEEIISLQKINSATINKDGTFVVYELSIADWQTDNYVRELWLYDVLRDKHEQIICKDESYMGGAKWSPDGKKLALLMQKDGKPQIYIIEIENRKKFKFRHTVRVCIVIYGPMIVRDFIIWHNRLIVRKRIIGIKNMVNLSMLTEKIPIMHYFI